MYGLVLRPIGAGNGEKSDGLYRAFRGEWLPGFTRYSPNVDSLIDG